MSGKLRSPLFEMRRSPWWGVPGGQIPPPISFGAFFLALLLVFAVSALVGEIVADRMLTARPPVTMTGASGPVAELEGMRLRVESDAWDYADRVASLGHATSIE